MKHQKKKKILKRINSPSPMVYWALSRTCFQLAVFFIIINMDIWVSLYILINFINFKINNYIILKFIKLYGMNIYLV